MRIAVAAVVLLSSSLARAETEAPFPCVGRWQGVGRNTGFPTTWTIDMVVHVPDATGSCGTIEYTTPECGGVMDACVGSSEVRVRERYTHGEGRCAPPGELRFTCNGDKMAWEWHGWEVVKSTLTRVGPAPPAPAEVPAPDAPAPTSSPRTEPTGTEAGPEPRARRSCSCELPGGPGRASAPAGCLALMLALLAGSRKRRQPPRRLA